MVIIRTIVYCKFFFFKYAVAIFWAGYVNFMDKGPAFDDQLVAFWNNNQQVYIGVDSKNVVSDSARGRNAVRITSNNAYNGNNLIIIDAEHMPATTGSLPSGCGLWPAFW